MKYAVYQELRKKEKPIENGAIRIPKCEVSYIYSQLEEHYLCNRLHNLKEDTKEGTKKERVSYLIKGGVIELEWNPQIIRVYHETKDGLAELAKTFDLPLKQPKK